jgi:hypothetical protein
MGEPFVVTDCTLISIATGEQAPNLRELSDRSKTIHLHTFLTLIFATLQESVVRIEL